MISDIDIVGEYQPQAVLRASRTYYHSTDCYLDLLAGVEQIFGACCDGSMMITFRSLSNLVPRFIFAAPNTTTQRPSSATSDFRVGLRGGMHYGWIVPGDAQIILHRPYDETPVAQAARLDGQSLVIDCDTGMQPIEVVTALGVLLLNRLQPPPLGRKWLAGRLQFNSPLASTLSSSARVALRGSNPGGVMRLDVTSGGAQVGSMLFSLGDLGAV
jgi:hypothetical protein